jgi:putative transposase
MADLRVRPVFSRKGQPHGHGKIERFMETMNQMCLAHLAGYAPKGSKDRAAQATLTLAELDAETVIWGSWYLLAGQSDMILSGK